MHFIRGICEAAPAFFDRAGQTDLVNGRDIHAPGVGHAATVDLLEPVPVRHLDDKREAVGQRLIEGHGSLVEVVAVFGFTRVHGGPAVTEPGQVEALDAALVD